ncbi:MAG TPA: DUF1800 domain-containing protein [Terriglobales bacterium]|nr:DUF1800 domain-containing protein [Terriglobales bacterium]
MKVQPRSAALALLLSLAIPASLLLGADKKPKSKPASAPRMEEAQRAAHALNRLTFGPRPGEVQAVLQMGVDKWIEQQLHPEKIDDSALQARLEGFKTLGMSTREIAENFPPPQVLKAIADGKMPMPSDPKLRAQYEAQVAAYRERQERRQGQAGGDNAGDTSPDKMSDQQKEARMYADLKADELLQMTPEQRMQEIMKMTPEERQAFAQSLDPQQRQQMMGDLSPQQREAVMAMVAPQQVVGSELMQAKLVRAVYSQRQLEEVMTDFWFNHFNVFLNKGADRYLVTSYERDVIRPRALGKFRDLLEATAKSPAMLFYLDNWLSVGPDSDFARYGPGGGRGNRGFGRNRGRMGGPFGYPPRPQQQPRQRQQQAQQGRERRGLNENYARELMELHTLSVNGGYTQQDVIEVAKCFTGWTIEQPQRGGGFQFNERMHQPGNKTVLGHKIKQGGEKEGEQVLDLLSRDPHTAQFIARKLAVRFVSDDPPQPLVDRMAQTFLKSDGDIREVLRTLFRSPEFWAPETYRAKVKTPLEFVVSAVRASGADLSDAQPLVGTLNRMGMPLYGMQTPNGYSWKADAWVNSNALLTRMNFALALGSGHLRGAPVDISRLMGASPPADPSQGLAVLEQVLLQGDLSKNTHDAIEKRLADPQVTQRKLDDPQRAPNLGVLAGLLMGSPEFQRR